MKTDRCFTIWTVRILLLIAIGLWVVAAHANDLQIPGEDLPNVALTQGANAVDEAGAYVGVRDVKYEDLCPHANTKAVRNVPDSVKKQVFEEYGLKPMTNPDCTGPGNACYEIDHDCSLQHGCSNDIRNLWPQRYDGTIWNAHVKDRLEGELHSRICSRAMTIDEAQQCISTDWIECYKRVYERDVP